MARPQIVLDTNVLVSGLRSRHGTAYQLLSLVDTGRFDIHLSVPLALEYEDALSRQVAQGKVTQSVVDAVLDFHFRVARRHPIFFLWRPFLRDPRDDMVLELAVKAGCEIIVTFNERDFAGVEKFGIRALPPAAFLREIGELP
jgi:putative PIN family toxin of toxin-antitoxin system